MTYILTPHFNVGHVKATTLKKECRRHDSRNPPWTRHVTRFYYTHMWSGDYTSGFTPDYPDGIALRKSGVMMSGVPMALGLVRKLNNLLRD